MNLSTHFTKPYKILCFHGFRTNQKVLEFQLNAIRNKLPVGEYEFVCLDAPHAATGPATPDIISFFGEQEYFQWWDSKTKDGIVEYVGMDETISYIQNYIRKNGPFRGILGFSQGGILATMITALLEQDPSFLPSQYHWQYTVCIGSLPPRVSSQQYLFETKLKTDSLHVIGQSDQYKEYSDLLVKKWDTQYTTVVEHSEGHRLPSKNQTVAIEQIAEFFTERNGYWWAFDFDGVLCDSASETGTSGWKAASGIIPEAGPDTNPSSELLSKFVRVRPVLETGYQAITLMYLLHKGVTVEEILKNPHGMATQGDNEIGLSVEELKQRFHECRTNWIERNQNEWLESHNFYQKAVDSVKLLIENNETVYIITTKHKDFAVKLLQKAGLEIPNDRVFGLGSGKKLDVLSNLAMEEHNKCRIPFFLEDRKNTLVSVNAGTLTCRLALADWGYNTELDRESTVEDLGVPVISLESFASIISSELTTQD